MTKKLDFLAKKKEADTIIKRYTLISAGTGFIPIPFVDAVAMSGVQYTMIRKLAALYEIPFKGHRVKAINAAFIGSIGTISGFKFIPKIGTVLGGMTASTIGAASTYAIGQVFTQHFDQGGTLLDFDPLASRVHFEEELERGKVVVAKLKEEATLNTKKGKQKVIQQLKADSEEYLLQLAELQVSLEQYKNQLSKPTLMASAIAPLVAEKSVNPLEDTQIIEPTVEKRVLLSEETQTVEPVAEKLSWWRRK